MPSGSLFQSSGAVKKTRKLSGFVIDSHLKDNAFKFVAVKREADLN